MSSSGKFYTNNYSHLLVCAKSNLSEVTGLQKAVFRLEALTSIWFLSPSTQLLCYPVSSCSSLKVSLEDQFTDKQGFYHREPLHSPWDWAATNLGLQASCGQVGAPVGPSTISSSLATSPQTRIAESDPFSPLCVPSSCPHYHWLDGYNRPHFLQSTNLSLTFSNVKLEQATALLRTFPELPTALQINPGFLPPNAAPVYLSSLLFHLPPSCHRFIHHVSLSGSSSTQVYRP